MINYYDNPYPVYTYKKQGLGYKLKECFRALKHVKLQRRKASGILLICSEDKSIYLMKRSRVVLLSGTWAIPGGSVKENETPLLGALRECFEEMNSVPVPTKKIGQVKNINPFIDYTTYAYDISFKSKTYWNPKINCEHSDAKWFSLDKLPENIHPGVKRAMNRLKLRKQYG
ncbi:MAG TPA: NUDIX hydrolase [Desulfosporosinus sp.]|nr:NUDIX hydrolase [Desulfosporosinus sp.]